MAKNKLGGMKAKRVTGDVITYIFLAVMCIIWLLPFFWVIMQSFRDGKGQFISTFLPTAYTFNNSLPCSRKPASSTSPVCS